MLLRIQKVQPFSVFHMRNNDDNKDGNDVLPLEEFTDEIVSIFGPRGRPAEESVDQKTEDVSSRSPGQVQDQSQIMLSARDAATLSSSPGGQAASSQIQPQALSMIGASQPPSDGSIAPQRQHGSNLAQTGFNQQLQSHNPLSAPRLHQGSRDYFSLYDSFLHQQGSRPGSAMRPEIQGLNLGQRQHQIHGAAPGPERVISNPTPPVQLSSGQSISSRFSSKSHASQGVAYATHASDSSNHSEQAVSGSISSRQSIPAQLLPPLTSLNPGSSEQTASQSVASMPGVAQQPSSTLFDEINRKNRLKKGQQVLPPDFRPHEYSVICGTGKAVFDSTVSVVG